MIFCKHVENSDTCEKCKEYSRKIDCLSCSGQGGTYPDKYGHYVGCCKGFATHSSLWAKCFRCNGTGMK